MVETLEQLISYEHSVWILAFLFYLIDVVRVNRPGEVLLEERGGNRLRAVLARNPLEWRGGELYVVAALRPYTGVLRGRWHAALDDGPSLDLSRLAALRAGLLPFRVGSSAVFVALFGLGPLLTAHLGLAFALLAVAPAVYLVIAVLGVAAVRRSAQLGLTRGRSALLLVEALLCAPYGANWVKRLCSLQPPLATTIDEVGAAALSIDMGDAAATLAQRRVEPQ